MTAAMRATDQFGSATFLEVDAYRAVFGDGDKGQRDIGGELRKRSAAVLVHC